MSKDEDNEIFIRNERENEWQEYKAKRIYTEDELLENENRIFYNYKDGSAYYIDSDGVMYCGYDGKSLQKAASTSVKTAIDLGIISDPSTMQSDYIYGQIGVGIYKNLSASVGFIVDKQGDIYCFEQDSVGAGLSAPINIGYGKGMVNNSWKDRYGDDALHMGISGSSESISGSSIVSCSISSSRIDGAAVTIEIGVETSVGVSYSKRIAHWVGKIE